MTTFRLVRAVRSRLLSDPIRGPHLAGARPPGSWRVPSRPETAGRGPLLRLIMGTTNVSRADAGNGLVEISTFADCDRMCRELVSLSYRSRVRLSDPVGDMVRIMQSSRMRNPRLGITGILLYNGLHFVQTLEGPQEACRDLFLRISQDPRHSEIIAFGLSTIEQAPVPRLVHAPAVARGTARAHAGAEAARPEGCRGHRAGSRPDRGPDVGRLTGRSTGRRPRAGQTARTHPRLRRRSLTFRPS
ncbi:FAD-dependent sensor of blue light [Cereibacter azotoformans]|uniref:FAD-dependent sensor of blue light n=1 Tax=Cereibacter azotoformans TaxID=43057 RepID=A0A2T5JJJ5_9RHOB|nr:FAD-dependent sensor of blue light [Cereibacter azotoformans]